MVGSIKDYTTHLKLIIPRFDVATWHDFMESNFRAIDALFYNLYGINNFSGEWSKVTQYTEGQVIFIGEDIDLDGKHTIYEGRLVKVLQDHTTDNSDYFNIYQSLHPEYYQLFFDANNAEVFAENAFNYMNTTKDYKDFTESLKNLYEDYLNQTNIAKNDAQSAANDANLSKNEAIIASNTAIQTVNVATNLLNEVEEFTQGALITINAAKDTTIATVNNTKDEAISTIQETVENAQNTIDEKITTAEEELDDTIRTAIVEAKDEVKAEADKAIQNAGEIAANYAKNAVTSYTNEVIIPRIDNSTQEAKFYADQSQNSAITSQNSAFNAQNSERLASNHENNARDYAFSANTSADRAQYSENSCREILERIGTVIRIIGRVNTYEDLPTSGNIDGDAYLVGVEGLDSYPEYYWYNDHWEYLGSTATKLSWGAIEGTLSNQTDLQNALNDKQDTISDLEDIRTNASAGADAANTIARYGDIVTHNASEFLSSDIELPTKTSDLINDSGYITKDVNDLINYTNTTDLNTSLSKKQDTLIAGDGINITDNVITAKGIAEYDSSTKTIILR